MNVNKIAIIGTSSAGKTTLTYEVLGKLKRLGVLADGVIQQDRRLTFDRDLVETEPHAQYWFLCNQVIRETEMALKRGVDVLVSDRSIVDFYAYYETMYGRQNALYGFVKHWATTYDTLYYLDPLPFHDDGVRPPPSFVVKVDETLRNIIQELTSLPDFANRIFSLPRTEVYQHLLGRINRILTEEEILLMPGILGESCLLGGSYAFNRATKTSDVDIYLIGSEFKERFPNLEASLKATFGANFEVRQVTQAVADYLRGQGFRYLELKQ